MSEEKVRIEEVRRILQERLRLSIEYIILESKLQQARMHLLKVLNRAIRIAEIVLALSFITILASIFFLRIAEEPSKISIVLFSFNSVLGTFLFIWVLVSHIRYSKQRKKLKKEISVQNN